MGDETASVQSSPKRQYITWILIVALPGSIATCLFLWGWLGEARYLSLIPLPLICALIAFMLLVVRVATARQRSHPALQLLTFMVLSILAVTNALDFGRRINFIQSRAEFDAFVDAVGPNLDSYEDLKIPGNLAEHVYMARGVRFPDGTEFVTLWYGYAFPGEKFGFGRIDGDLEIVLRDPVFGEQLGRPIGDGWWIVRD